MLLFICLIKIKCLKIKKYGIIIMIFENRKLYSPNIRMFKLCTLNLTQIIPLAESIMQKEEGRKVVNT